MSAAFLQERQGQPCIGFGDVSHVSVDRPRCVSCIRRKRTPCEVCRGCSETSFVALCGIQRMESGVCAWSWLSVTHDLFPCHARSVCFIAVIGGIARSVGCAFLRHCTFREKAGAFGPCTVPRTSHSPSSLRACHLRLHGETGQCGVPQYALWLT